MALNTQTIKETNFHRDLDKNKQNTDTAETETG